MLVLERGEARHVLVLDVVALYTELGNGGAQVVGVPQNDGVENQAESGEGERTVHQTAVGAVDRVDHGEQVHGLVDPPELVPGPLRGDEVCAQRRSVPGAINSRPA